MGGSLAARPQDGMYKKLILPAADLSSPAKQLIDVDGLRVNIDESKRSMFADPSDDEDAGGGGDEPDESESSSSSDEDLPEDEVVPRSPSPVPVRKASAPPVPVVSPSLPVVEGRLVSEKPERPVPKRKARSASTARDVPANVDTAERRSKVTRTKARAEVAEPPVLPAARKSVQTQLKSRISTREVPFNDPFATCAPVDPPLTPDSAATRFVFTPADVFDSTDCAGWIGRIVSVARDKQETTKVKYHDGVHYFRFEYVQQHFKPLT